MYEKLVSLTLLACLALTAQPHTTVWSPSTIPWREINPDGSKYAVLEGSRDTRGTFTYAFFLPNGVWVAPHHHSGSARVFVVSGTLLLGQGEKLEKSKAQSIGTGSVFFVPSGDVHWEGASGDTLIIGVGTGPWKTSYLE